MSGITRPLLGDVGVTVSRLGKMQCSLGLPKIR